MPLEQVLLDVELLGIRLDVNKLIAYREKLLSENKQHMAQMSLLAGKEINSIEEELYGKVLSTKKSDKGKANVQKKE